MHINKCLYNDTAYSHFACPTLAQQKRKLWFERIIKIYKDVIFQLCSIAVTVLFRTHALSTSDESLHFATLNLISHILHISMLHILLKCPKCPINHPFQREHSSFSTQPRSHMLDSKPPLYLKHSNFLNNSPELTTVFQIRLNLSVKPFLPPFTFLPALQTWPIQFTFPLA